MLSLTVFFKFTIDLCDFSIFDLESLAVDLVFSLFLELGKESDSSAE